MSFGGYALIDPSKNQSEFVGTEDQLCSTVFSRNVTVISDDLISTHEYSLASSICSPKYTNNPIFNSLPSSLESLSTYQKKHQMIFYPP